MDVVPPELVPVLVPQFIIIGVLGWLLIAQYKTHGCIARIEQSLHDVKEFVMLNRNDEDSK